jgi:F0F1-type ATP synthase assembly protein I
MMPMRSPFNIAIVSMTVPFIVSLVAAWAWGWRGIVSGIAGGTILTFLFYLTQSVVDIRDAGFHVRPPRTSLSLSFFYFGLLDLSRARLSDLLFGQS